jgi:hypothetical protein
MKAAPIVPAGAPAVSIKMRERSFSGWARANFMLTMPPIEWPRRSGGARPRSSTTYARSWASRSNV